MLLHLSESLENTSSESISQLELHKNRLRMEVQSGQNSACNVREAKVQLSTSMREGPFHLLRNHRHHCQAPRRGHEFMKCLHLNRGNV